MLNPTTLILSKNSSENEIRTYFYKVLELKQSNEQFPVDLDEVWPLVYSAKEKAVRALKAEFIQDVDFQSLAQNGYGGKFAATDYKLTLSCMEYFIAALFAYSKKVVYLPLTITTYILGQITDTYLNKIKGTSSMVVREEMTVQPQTPCVCCDSHTYGGRAHLFTNLNSL